MDTSRHAGRAQRAFRQDDTAAAADGFDPVDFERRLDQARLRRARLLEARDAGNRSQDIASDDIDLPAGPATRTHGGSPARLGALATGIFAFGVASGLAAALVLLGISRTKAPDPPVAVVTGETLDPSRPVSGAPGLTAEPVPEPYGRPPESLVAAQPLPFQQIPQTTPHPAPTGRAGVAESEFSQAAVRRIDAAVRKGEISPIGVGAEARLRIYAPPSVDADEIAASVAGLRGAGFSEIETGPAGVSIAMPNVRYFHAGDSETATRVAAALAKAGTGAAVRDFTHLSPAPDSGTIEIWLSGEAPQVAATPQRSSVGSPSGGVLQIARPRGLLGRIFSAVGIDSPASSRSVSVSSGSGPIASFRAIAPSRRTEANGGGRPRGFQSDAAGRSQSVSSRGDSSGRGSGATQRASAAGGSLTAGGSRTVSSSPDTGSSNSGAASVARSTSPASAGSRAPGGSGAAAGDDRGRGGSSSANAGPGGKSHGKSSAAGPGNNNAGGNGKSKGNSKGKGGGSAGAGKGGPGGGKGKSGGKKD